jgi:hypothetical protein
LISFTSQILYRLKHYQTFVDIVEEYLLIADDGDSFHPVMGFRTRHHEVGSRSPRSLPAPLALCYLLGMHNPPGTYEMIAVWRRDLQRIRELEHTWRRSRVATIHTLLDIAAQSVDVRPVTVSAEAWDRLDELAIALRTDRDELMRRVIDLLSHCTPKDLARLLGEGGTPAPRAP